MKKNRSVINEFRDFKIKKLLNKENNKDIDFLINTFKKLYYFTGEIGEKKIVYKNSGNKIIFSTQFSNDVEKYLMISKDNEIYKKIIELGFDAKETYVFMYNYTFEKNIKFDYVFELKMNLTFKALS